ncbi:MAG: aminopeptidase [Ignavibacteria bacterium]|nr:aminopeptidase [Ignavibacteria bacterium]
MKFKHLFQMTLIIVLIPILITAQAKKKKERYEFKHIYELKTTPVKNQSKTGTCWSFATTSFIETELIRMGKGEIILSPMYFVRLAYPQKAARYVRYHGDATFGPGGQAHDVMNVIKNHGFVPEDNYKGMNIDEDEHNHGEMHSVLENILSAVIKNRGGKVTPLWPKVFESALDFYLGSTLKEFDYANKSYTPISFSESLGFNPDNYIELTSYTHHPYFSKIDLEVPDNWSRDLYYNIPIDDLIKTIDYAIANGFSIAWDGDTSEKEFDRKKGYAIIPIDADSIKEEEDDKKTIEPYKEKTITQEMRQETFDNYTTTDDHLMHLTGIAADQTGAKFYYTKNSWGTKDKKYDGYWYMSLPYVKLKTIAIMVHKDAVPAEIKTKIGL